MIPKVEVHVLFLLKLQLPDCTTSLVLDHNYIQKALIRIQQIWSRQGYDQIKFIKQFTVNNYMQVTGIATGENFAFFIYRHFVEIS